MHIIIIAIIYIYFSIVCIIVFACVCVCILYVDVYGASHENCYIGTRRWPCRCVGGLRGFPVPLGSQAWTSPAKKGIQPALEMPIDGVF